MLLIIAGLWGVGYWILVRRMHVCEVFAGCRGPGHAAERRRSWWALRSRHAQGAQGEGGDDKLDKLIRNPLPQFELLDVYRNPFTILDLERSADDADVSAAFRRLSKIYHPDVPITGDATQFNSLKQAASELGTLRGRKFWRPLPAEVSRKRYTRHVIRSEKADKADGEEAVASSEVAINVLFRAAALVYFVYSASQAVSNSP